MRAELVDCAAIVACGLLVALALRPFQDTPFVDDWVYAWSVEHLLGGGGLAVLDWSSHPNFAHVLWGALFCLPAGFSFVALRLSTWVAALLALCAFHLLLREIGVARREALLGTALLGCNPVFFVLAATFMTDVPLLAAILWASFALVAALHRASDRWLAAFVAFACVAMAVRVVAIVAPLAAVATLATQGGTWGRRPSRLLAAASPLAFFALLMFWGAHHTVHVTDLSRVVGSPAFRRLYLSKGLADLPQLTLRAVLCAAGTLGIALLPLTAAAVRGSTVRRALPALAVLVAMVGAAAWAHADWPPALAPSFTWTYGELGATESLVEAKPALAVPGVVVAAVTALGFASSALALGIAWRRLRADESFLAWSLAGQLGLVAVLWLFYDRYLLALLPLAIALVLVARPALQRGVFGTGIAVLVVLSLIGVRDHLSYNAALWRTVELLRAGGVPDAQIDAGYVVDGWLHFARPEHAPVGANGDRLFPWITAPGGLLPYQVANRPLPGWHVLATVPFHRWLGALGRALRPRATDRLVHAGQVGYPGVWPRIRRYQTASGRLRIAQPDRVPREDRHRRHPRAALDDVGGAPRALLHRHQERARLHVPVERRVDVAGTERRDRDAVLLHLGAHRFEVGVQPRLGRRVGAVAGQTAPRRDRRHPDDVTAAGGAEQLDARLDGRHRTEQVGAHDAQVGVEAPVAGEAAAADAGVGDQQVDLAEAAGEVRDRLQHRGRVVDVEDRRLDPRTGAVLLDLAADLLEHVAATRAQAERMAAPRELEGECAADARRGAGDDRRLAHDRRSIRVALASPPPSHMVCRP